MSKAGLYIRVSTEEQAREGFSIDAQKAKLTAYCQIHDLDIHAIYIDDGISGKNLNRTKVKELIDDIKSKDVDTLIVFKLDRLTRSVEDLSYLIRLFDKNKVKFISLSEQIDTSTATGRMFVYLLGVFAEWEREVIAERVVVGMEQRAKEGFYTAKRVLGYDYNPETKQYTINENEAKIVRLIFKLHNEGKGYYLIAKTLNNMGYKTKDGNSFAHNSLNYMVNHGWYYCGKFMYKAKGKEPQLLDAKNIEPILTYEEFTKAQKIKNANFSVARKYGVEDFIFKGRIFCECGAPIKTATSGTPSRKEPYRYYYCRRNLEGRCNCFKQIAMTKLHNQFYEFLCNYFQAPVSIDVNKNQNIIKEYDKDIIRYSNELEKEQARKKKLTMMFLDEQIDNQSYQEMLSDLNKRIELINSNLDTTKQKINSLNLENNVLDKKKIALKLAQVWPELTLSQQKEFVQVFIKKLVINSTGIIEVEFMN